MRILLDWWSDDKPPFRNAKLEDFNDVAWIKDRGVVSVVNKRWFIYPNTIKELIEDMDKSGYTIAEIKYNSPSGIGNENVLELRNYLE